MARQNENTPDKAIPRWLDELRPGGTGGGFLEKRFRHSLLFVKRPVKRLLVTFDNLANVGDTSLDREPWAFKFARDENISHLGIMAHVSDWYRDPELIDRMKELADSGFFDGYDRVVFAGVSMGGFASIAFGSLVPGAHIISINPQSTLDTTLVPWETRYLKGRRQDWTLPLSDAAALTKGLGAVNIFYDPYHELDKKHVSRFSGDNIRVFHCRYSDHKTAVFLRKIDALKPIMHAAIFGELSEKQFYQLYRRRRILPWFRGSLSSYFKDLGRDELADLANKLCNEQIKKHKRAELASAQGEPASEPDPKPAQTHVAAPSLSPARFQRNDRRLIVTTMKNEGPFMLEWVAHNRAIGFTDFLIYTNHCDDGTDKIAMRLEELGVARHIDNVFKQGASPQRVALRRALQTPEYKSADWVICADCDEFLNIRAGDGKLDDLIKAAGDADAISFCWKIFGNGGVVDYADKFVTEQFFWGAQEDFRGKYKALGLKTLFRPHDVVTKIGVHRPKFNGKPDGFIWKDAGGKLMPDQYYTAGWSAYGKFTHTYARLHHYAVRSADSFLVKRDRGRTNHIDRDQGVAYWADLNLNMEQDRSIQRLQAETQAEFDKLLADPELKRLHQDAVTWHREKIETIKESEDSRKFHTLLQRINKTGEPPVNRDELLMSLAAE